MFFKFVAVSKDHRRIDGTIESADERTARDTLHANELAVLTIAEITEAECKQLQAQETPPSQPTATETRASSQPSEPMEEVFSEPLPAAKTPSIETSPETPFEIPLSEMQEERAKVLEPTEKAQEKQEETAIFETETPPLSEELHTKPSPEGIVFPENTEATALIQQEEGVLLEEKKEALIPSGLKRFWFSAVDDEEKPLAGTIDAVDLQNAHKRLTDEFHLEILSMRSNDELGEEIDLSSLFTKTETERNLGANEQLSEEFLQQKEGLGQISRAIGAMGEKFLQTYENELLTARPILEDVKRNIDVMNRIRDSHNLETIKKTIQLLGNGIKQGLERCKGSKKHEQALKDLGTIEHFLNVFAGAAEKNNFDKKKSQILAILDGKTRETTLPKWLRPLFVQPCRAPSQNSPIEVNQRLEKILSLYEEEINELWRSWFSPSKAWRTEAKILWEKIREERNTAMQELAEIEKHIVLPPASSLFLFEFRNFTGWLLAFYLLYFGFASLVFEKSIPFSPDFVWKTISSPLLLAILFALFILNGALTIKIHFLADERKKSSLLFLGAFLLIFLFVFNF